MKENGNDTDILEREPLGKALLKQMPKTIIDIIGDCIPVFGGSVKTIADNLYAVISKNKGV